MPFAGILWTSPVDCQCSLHKCNVHCNVRIIITWTLIILGEISGTKGKVHEDSVWQTQGSQKIYACTCPIHVHVLISQNYNIPPAIIAM